MTKTTGEFERDAERTRSEVSATLDEIRTRMEPGQIVDQAFSYARNNGGSDFVKNAAMQARDNPIPVVLIGVGLAWLMSGRKPSSGPSYDTLRDAGVRGAHDVRDTSSGVAGAVGDAMSAASDGVRGAFSAGKSGARDAGDKVGSFASVAGDRLQSGGAQITDAVGQLQRLCAENPIAVGAIGLAVGAAIGAAFPTTETENRLVGAHADELKSSIKSTADEQIERGERALHAGLEEARDDPKPSH